MLKPPYKNASNVWYTRALFWEQVINLPISERVIDPVFTLYDDKPGLINARKTFVAMNDPSGYKWAMHYLGDYEHWKALMKCKWFVEAHEEWVNEIKVKLQSESLDIIREIAKEGQPAQALVAAKYLASAEWDKKTKGRPAKADIEREAKKQAEARTVEDEDLLRIGLKVVK